MLKYSYDPSGNVATQTLASVLPPQITGQPIQQIVEPGQAAAFSVVVSDASGVTYQWKFNGTDIPGAAGDSLLLTNVSAANRGQYSVIVTNSAGSVTSAPAALMLDSDRDGLPDTWEATYFTDLDPNQPLNPANQRSDTDPDEDEVSNLDEFLDGTIPTSNTSLRPRLIAYSDAGGSVTVAPMKLSYDLGETVTLTATPFAPSVFIGWTEDLNSTSNPATLAMSGNRVVRARFASAVPLPPGLIALWRGETDATDLIGSHHGAFFAGASATAPRVTVNGKVGGAFNFDGTVYVRVPDSTAALKPAQITVEAWVFPTVLSGDHQTVIACGSSGDTNDTWYLGVFDGKPRFWSHGAVLLEGPSAIPLNRWTHLVISFDGTTKRLYVDGVQVGSQGGLSDLVYDAAVPVTIGSDWSGNAPVAFFNGRVDEVAIYNRMLTANEVADIYNADFVGKNFTQPYFTSPSQLPDVTLGASYTQQLTTILGTAPVSFSLSEGVLPPGMTLSLAGAVSGAPSVPGIFDFTVLATDASGMSTEQLCVLRVLQPVEPPVGLVAWWRAEGNAQDAAGANHGLLRNGAGFSAGKVGQAFSLDGTNDFIEIPDAPALRPAASLTLEAWVAFDATSGPRAIFAKPVGTGINDSYALWLASGTLRGLVGDAAGNGPELATSFSPAPGRWYHVAYTFDDDVNQQALYIDGIRVAIGPVTKSIGYDAQPLLLGRDTENGIPNFFLQGRIDEAAIYERALNGTDIASIYNAGPAGKRLLVI